jgi:hypothetical protein
MLTHSAFLPAHVAVLIAAMSLAAQGQTETSINSYLATKLQERTHKKSEKQPTPLILGTGSSFLATSSCIDPRLMVGIAGQESRFGMSHIATRKFNALSYADVSTCKKNANKLIVCEMKDYSTDAKCKGSLDCNIREATQLVEDRYNLWNQVKTTTELSKYYCGGPYATPEFRKEQGCDKWVTGVELFYRQQLVSDRVPEDLNRLETLVYRQCAPPRVIPPCVSPMNLHFEKQKLVKTPGKTPVSVRSFVIDNCGTTPLALTLQRSNDLSNSFSFLPQQQLKFNLQPQEKTKAFVRFTASSVGRQTAKVIIAGGEDKSVLLSGIGAVAQLMVPADVDFGQAEVGTVIDTNVEISNSGQAPTGDLRIVVKPESQFHLLQQDETPLPSGGKRTLRISYSAIHEGESRDTVTVEDSDGDGALIQLHATGIGPKVELSPSVADFGKVKVGSKPVSLEFKITNNGLAPARNVKASIINNGGEVFRLQGGDLQDLLQPHQVLSFTVVFEPEKEGRWSGKLNFNGSNIGQIGLDLAGNGVLPRLVLEGDMTVNFGQQKRGASSNTRTVLLSNGGSSDLTILSAHVSGKGFELVHSLNGISLPSGESKAMEISFHPLKVGMYSAVVSLETDDPMGPQTVALLGIGTHRYSIPWPWKWFHPKPRPTAN